MGYEGPTHYLRIRGLPWQSSREDVVAFFDDCKIMNGVEGVHMTLSPQGRPSGEAYIEMETEDDANRGIKKHLKSMGTRYIEVFLSNKAEFDWILRRFGKPKMNLDPNFDGFIRLRGLPFDSDQRDIRRFFEGLEIVRNGVIFTSDQRGRPTGEAYVQFSCKEMADKAMGKHKEKIGHRYIEIFKSSPHEFSLVSGQQLSRVTDSGKYGNCDEPFGGGHSSTKRNYSLSNNRLAPYDRDYNSRNHGPSGSKGFPSEFGVRRPYSSLETYERGTTKRFAYQEANVDELSSAFLHIVHMRGLPYKATELDIIEFFAPIMPCSIKILFDESNRPSGKADVEFKTHEEAELAMKKDKSNMQHRYIELFLHSRPSLNSPELSPVKTEAAFYDDMSGYSNSYRGQFNRNDQQSTRDFARTSSTNTTSPNYLVRLPPSASLVGPKLSMKDFLRSRVH